MADRWLLMRAGPHRLAARMEDVGSLDAGPKEQGGAPPGAGDPCVLGYVLGLRCAPAGAGFGAGGVVVRARASDALPGICVDAVEGIVEGPALAPMPELLRRVLGAESVLTGAILCDGRPVWVVDLARAAGCGAAGHEGRQDLVR